MKSDIVKIHKEYDNFLERYEPEIINCSSMTVVDYVDGLSFDLRKDPVSLKSHYYYNLDLLDKYKNNLVLFGHNADMKFGYFSAVAQISIDNHILFGVYSAIDNKEPITYLTVATMSFKDFSFGLNFIKENMEFVSTSLYEDEVVGFGGVSSF